MCSNPLFSEPIFGLTPQGGLNRTGLVVNRVHAKGVIAQRASKKASWKVLEIAFKKVLRRVLTRSVIEYSQMCVGLAQSAAWRDLPLHPPAPFDPSPTPAWTAFPEAAQKEIVGLRTQTRNAALFERKGPERKPWPRGKPLKRKK